MPEQKLIDHLFRHQYGKMVSILTRIFGLHHLEIIEDAVQDTLINAMRSWQGGMPENPEAWLTKSAKNRVLDLLRQLSATDARIAKLETGESTIAINELFLDHEIDDSILRMIFTACNPALNPKDQIAFALNIIAGFSRKEIAVALLLKEETVKKRLVRSRKMIAQKSVKFEIPLGKNLELRLARVLEVIYLIFNEGFHSNRKEILIREDLCGEAMRLAQVLLKNTITATSESHALFALFCFQTARLKSKINDQNEIISLKEQDRSQWYGPLIKLGHQHMNRAVEATFFGHYHYEAAIAAEHIMAPSYDKTDWDKILLWYQKLNDLEHSPFNLLNMAVVQLQLKKLNEAESLLKQVKPEDLEQRAYLYYGTYAEYYYVSGNNAEAVRLVDKAKELVSNESELNYLARKKEKYQN